MTFTKKTLQTHTTGMSFIKGASLFFLGMSCVLFATQAFDIVPSTTNVKQYIQQILLTDNGSSAGTQKISLDGADGNGSFSGTVSASIINGTTINGTTINATTVLANLSGTTITGTNICLGGVCKTARPTAGGASVWSTGSTGKIYYTGGNVGIGTANPTYKLEVYGTGYFENTLMVNGTIRPSDLDNNLTFSALNHIFKNSVGATKVTINDSGYVGIGTTSPQSKLHVNGGIRGLNDLIISDDDVTFGEIHTSGFTASLLLKTEENDFSIAGSDSIVSFTNSILIPMRFLIENNEKMRIDSNGNVGIGTSSPSAKLEVASGNQKIQAFTTYTGYVDTYGDTISNHTTHINLSASAAMSGFSLGQDRYTNSYGGNPLDYKRNYIYSPNNTLTLSTNYSDKFDPMLVITTGGKIGIGTSSPTAKLTIEGGIKPIGTGASPCADTTNYPTGTMFYNSTSNYYCYCSGSAAKQIHSPLTSCY